MNILASLVESKVIKYDGCINVYLKNSINIDYNNIDSLEVVRYTKTKYNEAEDKLEYELDEIYKFNELAVDNKLISINVFKDDYVSIVYYNRDNHLITKDLSKFLVYYEQKEYVRSEEERASHSLDISLGKFITEFNNKEGYINFHSSKDVYYYINNPNCIIFTDSSIVKDVKYLPFIREYHVYVPVRDNDHIYFEDMNGNSTRFNIMKENNNE